MNATVCLKLAVIIFTTFKLKNSTNKEFIQKSSTVLHGKWKPEPNSKIKPGELINLNLISDGCESGTKGNIEYLIDGDNDTLIIFWDYTSTGNQFLNASYDKNELLVGISLTEGDSEVAGIVTIFEKNFYRQNYSIIVMSDPQPWRLETGDPNSYFNKYPWEERNENVVRSINKIHLSKNLIDFGIINGDITEFGRGVTRRSFQNIYQNLLFRFYIGLGNHDYANNVGDCVGEKYLTPDGAASESFEDMVRKLNFYEKELLINFEKHIISNKPLKGSASYSWDYGRIHYVQLQNYPTYQVELNPTFDGIERISVTKSLNWLKNDLEKAEKRGLVSLLNFHDGSDHFLANINEEEKSEFRDMINKFNVKIIFNGHTHKVAEKEDPKIFGNARVFESGALFLGDFFLVEISEHLIVISVYNGGDGTPILLKVFNVNI